MLNWKSVGELSVEVLQRELTAPVETEVTSRVKGGAYQGSF